MKSAIPVIIFLGAPGTGKGTQAMHLSLKKSIPRISTGDMLRHAVDDESDLGRKVQSIMKEGALVDDETMLRLVEDRILRPDCRNGFILDGYPRNLKQASQISFVLQPEMRLVVLNIEVPEDEIVKRLAGRRTCPRCERIYNIYFRPPRKEGWCDVDGTELMTRNDDSEEVIRKRLYTYRHETFPLISHYAGKNVMQTVDGSQAEEIVTQQILKLVEAR